MHSDCPDYRLDPPEDEPCGACEVCGLDIYQGDLIYQMPDGATVCEECLNDWAKDYERTA